MALEVVKYNDYNFKFPSVGFNATTEYDQSGRSLQGYLLTFSGKFLTFGSAFSEAQGDLQDALKALSEARKKFEWSVSGTPYFNVSPAPESVVSGSGIQVGNITPDTQSPGEFFDRRNGPKPKNIRVEQIPGGLSAWVHWSIETFVSFCESNKDIEEFWWAFDYTYDQNYICTRTIRGRVQARSGFDTAVRFLTTNDLWPPIPLGFSRRSFSHSTSADGRTIDFHTTDTQIWRTLPQPLTSGNATYRIAQQGMAIHKSMSCSFEAPLTVQKQVIMQFITALIRARFPDAIRAADVNVTVQDRTPKEFFTEFSITNHEFENRIEVSISSKLIASSLYVEPAQGNFQISFPESLLGDVQDVTAQQFGQPNDTWVVSNGKAFRLGPTGASGLIPQVIDPFDVCGGLVPTVSIERTDGAENDDTTKNFQPDESQPAEESGLSENYYDGTNLDDKPDRELNPNHEQYPYTSYQESISYIVDYNTIILAVTAPDTPDIIQRSANPSVRVLQSGIARRLGRQPEVPRPLWGAVDNDLVVHKKEVNTGSPNALPDGKNFEYRASWNYIVGLPAARTLQNLDTELVDSPGINPWFPTSQVLPFEYNDGVGGGNTGQGSKRVTPVPLQNEIDEDGRVRAGVVIPQSQQQTQL